MSRNVLISLVRPGKGGGCNSDAWVTNQNSEVLPSSVMGMVTKSTNCQCCECINTATLHSNEERQWACLAHVSIDAHLSIQVWVTSIHYSLSFRCLFWFYAQRPRPNLTESPGSSLDGRPFSPSHLQSLVRSLGWYRCSLNYLLNSVVVVKLCFSVCERSLNYFSFLKTFSEHCLSFFYSYFKARQI